MAVLVAGTGVLSRVVDLPVPMSCEVVCWAAWLVTSGALSVANVTSEVDITEVELVLPDTAITE